MNHDQKELRKSPNDIVFRGTLGGIAEHYGWSSGSLRAIFVLLTFFTAAFPGILLYIVLSILISEPNEFDINKRRVQ
ncbi:MAG: PspC domain-containing protein [Planctomycetes bacterium]|nr:PspC domain-containing protein [Planctomycetota bacterium]